jgi:shikimate 5-dehydrogenase
MAHDLGFLGVSTQHSLIRKLFPLWAEHLQLEHATLRGFDHPIDATAAAIRTQIQELRADPNLAGALVTTHKVAVWEHARAEFAALDEHAQRLGEVSCISRNAAGELVGHAKDPLTVKQALQSLAAETHWRTASAAEVLILGGGGAGLALTWVLLQQAARPAHIHIAETQATRRAQFAQHLQGQPPERWTLHAVNDTAATDQLLAQLPPHSLVVNATGMGKDRPGSPLSARATFPKHGRVWEFNYRGSLEFLRQAQAQAASQCLTIADGWEYFLAGWAFVIAEVYHFDLTPERFSAMAAVAQPLRPTHH